jgi:hypothetical protein
MFCNAAYFDLEDSAKTRRQNGPRAWLSFPSKGFGTTEENR